MTTLTASPASLPFELGEPHSFRGLTVVPLFPTVDCKLEYLGLDEALAGGLSVTEATESGDVNSLLLQNPLDERVLLYEGEELVGAKQNRIVERTVLVEAKTVIALPVSCVERGRWAYRSRSFSSAPRAAYPDLRRAQAAHREAGAQAMVWANVAERASLHDAFSPTEAAEELYVSREPTLEEYAQELPRVEGQGGALVAYSGSLSCLDYVGRSDVFAGLYAKLLRGYALEAVEHDEARPLRKTDVSRFLRAVAAAERRLVESAGSGIESRFEGGVLGSELSAFGELVALTAYAAAA